MSTPYQMENFLLELQDYQEMMATDIKTLEEDWREVYSKDFVLNLLSNYVQDFAETMAHYKEEENADN